MNKWEEPSFVEINMSAEIGSYQDDFDRQNEFPPFVSSSEATEQGALDNASR